MVGVRGVLAAAGLIGALTFPVFGDGAQAREVALPAKLVYVDVGQGDAVVMRIGGKVIVSDTGEHGLPLLQKTLRDGVKAKRIDVLILSHPHKDHVKNALELLAAWEVKLVVLSDSAYWGAPDTNAPVMAALRAEPGIKFVVAHAGEEFDWGGASWTFVNPPEGMFIGGEAQAANASLAYLLRVNGVSALFTGDVEARVAKRVAKTLDPKLDEPVDIFLATHHGSKHGSIDELLNVIHPRWAVVSTGKNKHKHPSLEALARLKGTGASIWCTETNGSVTARISASGTLSWRASLQVAPWWSAQSRKQTGSCVGR